MSSTAAVNLMDKARPAPDAATASAEAPRKRYHLGSVNGTPFQNIYLPASLATGTICFPQFTIYRSKPDRRGNRIEMPQPGAFHDLTEEDVACILKSCANRVVRWDATRQKPTIRHRAGRGFRPATGAEGEPYDEPLANYVYLREEPLARDGLPKAGGLFEPIVFAPMNAPDRDAAPRGPTPQERQEGAEAVEVDPRAPIAPAAPVATAAGLQAPPGSQAPQLRGAAAASAARRAAGAGAAARGGEGYREVDARALGGS